MSEANTTQLDLEKGFSQVSNDNDSSSPATMHKMKVETEDGGSEIESPTPEKRESRSKGVVVSSLARNLLAERYRDRFSNQLVEDEGQTDDEDYNGSVSPSSSQSLFSESIELLDKHKDLLSLFNRMESSIRLLHLRKKMATFNNIATQVEILTKRKLLYSHLAQMKHLFPEAIQIKRILVHDEKSLCMYADMEITLLMDVVECTSPDQSPSMTICEAFYSKLLSFLDAHHKGADIPEAILPELFNSKPREKLYLEAVHNGYAAESPLQGATEERFLNASHFPQSFRKLMSQKIIADGIQKTQLLSDPADLSSVIAYGTKGSNGNPKKEDEHAPVPGKYEISATPSRHLISCCQEGTPKQGTSESPLFSGTPVMQTPKRQLPTSLDKPKATCGHISEPCSASSARRSLNTLLKFEVGSPYYDGVEHTDTTKKGMISEDSSNFNKSFEEDSPVLFIDKDKIDEVDSVDSQEKIASLHTTFDIVCDISHPTKNSLITKQELFHNILANNLEIEEIGEIEEQLNILEDLAPDLISKKMINGGEILYSIQPISDQNSVRVRLVEPV
ncbi:CDT1a protein [Zea mays]|nr:CDT1a protein [Zea mays]NP_001394719.1 CDT1a protein [Zea mays]ACN25476.1 unknown [Zea mays]ONM12909.1 CDT1-like protein a chloroplastic [Zea mays]|eukprot:XP_008667881.1 CDT1a protein isoform X1 [Zea mays]